MIFVEIRVLRDQKLMWLHRYPAAQEYMQVKVPNGAELVDDLGGLPTKTAWTGYNLEMFKIELP